MNHLNCSNKNARLTDMNTETKDALAKSVHVWDANRKARCVGDVKIGIRNCPLCAVHRTEKDGCGQCPVALKTGQSYCLETPFGLARQTYDDWRDYLTEDDGTLRRRFLRAAAREWRFLRSLFTWLLSFIPLSVSSFINSVLAIPV